MRFSEETLKLIEDLKGWAPKLKAKKAEIHQRLKIERQCEGTTKNGERCRNWSVYGDTKCKRHGGVRIEPNSCACPAYAFPHRRRSGLCNYPDEPLGISDVPQGKRRYYKRMRKKQVKKWLKEIGL